MAKPEELRLLALEEKVAYQDKTIGELNEVVTELNRQLAEHHKRLAGIERVAFGELARREMPNEEPPHY